MRIELLGGMGSGKTTLCRVLEELGYNCIYEDLGQNPFMDDFYKDPHKYRFPSQMWMILSKYLEIQKNLKPTAINILDQGLDNYKAYTNMLFSDSSDAQGHKVIQNFFDYTEQRFGCPDLIVYLKVSPETQLKRIRGRGRDFEQSVELDYLKNLKIHLDRVFDEAQSKRRNVVEIDTEEVFMHEHHIFARDLAEDIAERLQFCLPSY